MTQQGLPAFRSFNHAIFQTLNSTAASLTHAQQAHGLLLKTGQSNETRLATKLLSIYAGHLCISDATLVFDSIPQPSVFSFSTLIHALSKLNRSDSVLRLFSRMISQGLLPDSYVLPSAVKACAGLSALKTGRVVHGFASTSGYARCGFADKAKELFFEMRNLGIEANSVSWNGMIAGFSHSGLHLEAVLMLQKMHLQGPSPDGTSISSVLSAVGSLEDLDLGVQIHGYVIKQGLALDKCVVSALIDMYGKCACTSEMLPVFDEMKEMDVGSCNALVAGLSRNGLVEDAIRVFAQFKGQDVELNVVSWTSMIACCSQNGRDAVALDIFREMQVAGVKPNSVTIPSLLPACGSIAALMHGKATHCFSLRRGISDDVYVGSALIDMYAKCGKIQASQLCFSGMPIKNLVCWNAIMSGYAMHGRAKEVLEIFHLMRKSDQEPDFISFTCVLSACSHGGLTEQGWYYFKVMSQEHGIEARMEHYACMVTLLGRAGKLEEAYSMIKKMPFKPDACVWGSLLSSCLVHKNVSLGETAAEELFELEPGNPGNYILLSNIYASKGMWNAVDRVRDAMKGMGLKKNPGCSWIEIKNKVHVLLAGDKAHPQMTQIIEKLYKLSMEMKKAGYYPISDVVLQDVEEQDKEQILCGHSEKLAVVLGLLNTSPGSPLRVIKNLRICGDCHAVIKFISSFEGREIFVRDTNRFHHFKDGECSCADYW
ncbi:pentatricopeptide repeat-containing protein At1g20230 isoform X2 [Malania oleifera]|uniref:pentatricopeptide repeat-containing protein At1g20230 isoform X2 n=1 Tax=Malania oleifera TaxID=397392 RepID=UPI0025AE4E9D|nr:pentatricopeptide repeat-containing protein At1g20230 isoform X2 [Malania oleifera]